MTTPFNAKSSADDVLAGIDLTGKRVLVTGVSAGLGVETARALVAHGARVTGAARDLEKASRALARSGAETVSVIALDLASLTSVRTCADALLADGRAFDLVICNAGVMAPPLGHTEDGFETQFGTNHLGHFVLVNRIVPLLYSGGRVVNLSSAGHRYSDVDLDDPNFERTPYDPWMGYGRSKTANILFSLEFDRRHKAQGVRATAVHPGGIATELGRHAFAEPGALQKRVDELNVERAAIGAPPFEMKSVPQGAATSVWAGVVASADEVGGRYCEDCRVSPLLTGEPSNAMTEGVRAYALDPERAAALWAKSEELVGERF
ncbi:SDR family NAD(P)-dependent oxidoreductase [Methylobacterium brachythecii]|nr:SDR family NAD(P)-dependent oxidoreductase [Methylobacterium brachythecii]MBB3903547.1 NAD(P)-dependent dehydrogenase (short-subunit alcohol dehydrogenase family) [Methylobacterium brachythecii]